MSRRSVRDWLRFTIKNSLLPAPTTYPYQASMGVMASYGFTPANISVFGYRPTKTMVMETVGGIIIEISEDESTQRTTQGPYGQREKEYTFGLSVMWIADFTGDPNATPPVAPTYTSEEVATEYFDRLLQAVESCIDYSIYEVTAPGQIGAANWPLTDPDTSKPSKLVAMQPRVKVYYSQPNSNENQRDIIYSAYIEFRVKEVYAVIDQ